MKRIRIKTMVTDRKTNEYIQRWATIDLTDEEVGLFSALCKSINKNHGGKWPFKIGGFGAEDPTDISLSSPLASKAIGCMAWDKKPKKYNRFVISNDLDIVDSETGEGAQGWTNI